MADGLCSGEQGDDVSENTEKECVGAATNVGGAKVVGEKVKVPFYLGSDQLFEEVAKLGDGGFCEEEEEDCRKKRCVDRYDSSESSDSGVAVLSCTDCSGSSTASSDITDPGSPFSTASNHSEDSATQPPKMPPTQTAHHPPWPWTADECSALNKRTIQIEKAATFPKRLKSSEDTNCKNSKQSPPCLNSSKKRLSDVVPSPVLKKPSKPLVQQQQQLQQQQQQQQQQTVKQGKITEYFKSQIKLHVIKKEGKTVVDQQTQFNGIRPLSVRSKTEQSLKNRKVSHHVTVPRKILPAPSKLPESLPLNNLSFAPTVTLTAVGFTPNLTYLHTKTPKPPDNIYVPQFATITNDKISTIPIINRTPCLNVIHQPVQKITAINNFNCVKLNATVVPIVKLNTLPSRLSVETAVPTVLAAKPKVEHKAPECLSLATPKQASTAEPIKCRIEEALRPTVEEKIPSPADSDSGVSFKETLEVTVGDAEVEPPQKSPILSQPKTIRFPPAKDEVKDIKPTQGQDSGLCRWADCNAQFDTSGALLEHLQIKHVISQATQEHYVCLWMGCKVHGRSSCSRSWLERHVLAHAGTKPFRCIVDGCGQRFNSQLTLERHVNGHFNSDGSQNNSAKKSTESASSKLLKRNGKKIRFRRQPWSARMFDFIDSGIMEGLQHRLLKMTQDRTMDQLNNDGNAVNVLSQVVARRVEPDGIVKFLVRWHPVDIIPDEWVTEKEYVRTKSVSIPSLEPSAKDALNVRLFPPKTRCQERRRKPISKQQT